MMDELISVLNDEFILYRDFIPVCREKTKAIIKNETMAIQEITMTEQEFLDKIGVLERKREDIVKNIGNVMNKDYNNLNIATIIKMLEKQPAEQKKLSEVHDNLKSTTRMLADINSQNMSLIKQSLEMIEFNMNFIQSTWMSPGTNNYNRTARAGENLTNYNRGMFDAKQ